MQDKNIIKQAIIICTLISFVCTIFLQYQMSHDVAANTAGSIIENNLKDLKVLPDVNVVKQLVKAFLNIVS